MHLKWRQTGVIEGSQLLALVDADGRVTPDFNTCLTAAIGTRDTVILICRTVSRTSMPGRYLIEQMGYAQVSNVRDGIARWISDDKPVKRL